VVFLLTPLGALLHCPIVRSRCTDENHLIAPFPRNFVPAMNLPQPPRSNPTGRSILLLEDNPDIAQIMKWTLEQAGYRVFLAQDGDEVFRLCLQANGNLDLLIADVVVPGISGLDVVRLVQSQWPDMKVLLCSGEFGALRSGLDLLREGTPFLKKPFEPETLVARVRHALGGESISEPGSEMSRPSAVPPMPAPGQDSPGSQTVLLVEDDKATLLSLAKILQRHGYRVIAASSGEEAIIRWGEHSIDVLVTDVVMPNMSGPELVKKLRATKADLPILYISGLLPEAGVMPLRPRRETFLPKPVSAEQLRAKIQGLLHIRA
jgi:DNA-binding response OmpR family regulator